MSLANTLRDIATESRLNEAEKTSLRLIATSVAKLERKDKLHCPNTKKEVDAKRAFVSKQANEASKTGFVTLRDRGEIRTGTIPVWMAFRCLYCGEYFNQSMAEDHFGMTREQLYADEKNEKKEPESRPNPIE